MRSGKCGENDNCGDFETQEREIPQPGPGQVRIRVQACGICHNDQFTKEGLWEGLVYPRAPGHEVAGAIDAVGAGVTTWKKGQRVGVGCAEAAHQENRKGKIEARKRATGRETTRA